MTLEKCKAYQRQSKHRRHDRYGSLCRTITHQGTSTLCCHRDKREVEQYLSQQRWGGCQSALEVGGQSRDDNEVPCTLHDLYHRNNSLAHEQLRLDDPCSYSVIAAWLTDPMSHLGMVHRADGWEVDIGEGMVPQDGCTTLRGCQCHIHMVHLASAMVAILVPVP